MTEEKEKTKLETNQDINFRKICNYQCTMETDNYKQTKIKILSQNEVNHYKWFNSHRYQNPLFI